MGVPRPAVDYDQSEGALSTRDSAAAELTSGPAGAGSGDANSSQGGGLLSRSMPKIDVRHVGGHDRLRDATDLRVIEPIQSEVLHPVG